MNNAEHLREYQEKLKAGLIDPPEKLDPIEKAKRNPKSLLLAINAKCYDCTCYQRNEIKLCEMTDCPLYSVIEEMVRLFMMRDGLTENAAWEKAYRWIEDHAS